MAALALTALGVFAGVMYFRYLWLDEKAAETFSELSEMVVRSTPVPATPTPVPSPIEVQISVGDSSPATDTPPEPAPKDVSEGTEETHPGSASEGAEPWATPVPALTPEPTPAPLADYEALHALNPDFFGWITVEGTRVDYPVMYSPDRPLQYLGHDFYGKFSYAGVPYLDAECDPEGKYYIVYGHHMKDGSIFSGLMAYEDPAFWAEHPTFRFDTRFERRTYAVVAAFRARVLTKEEKGFRYYSYSALDDEETFRTFFLNVRALAAYDTGVDAAFGDDILTLSTCAYHTEKGRFVVVAKRVE